MRLEGLGFSVHPGRMQLWVSRGDGERSSCASVPPVTATLLLCRMPPMPSSHVVQSVITVAFVDMSSGVVEVSANATQQLTVLANTTFPEATDLYSPREFGETGSAMGGRKVCISGDGLRPPFMCQLQIFLGPSLCKRTFWNHTLACCVSGPHELDGWVDAPLSLWCEMQGLVWPNPELPRDPEHTPDWLPTFKYISSPRIDHAVCSVGAHTIRCAPRSSCAALTDHASRTSTLAHFRVCADCADAP